MYQALRKNTPNSTLNTTLRVGFVRTGKPFISKCFVSGLACPGDRIGSHAEIWRTLAELGGWILEAVHASDEYGSCNATACDGLSEAVRVGIVHGSLAQLEPNINRTRFLSISPAANNFQVGVYYGPKLMWRRMESMKGVVDNIVLFDRPSLLCILGLWLLSSLLLFHLSQKGNKSRLDAFFDVFSVALCQRTSSDLFRAWTWPELWLASTFLSFTLSLFIFSAYFAGNVIGSAMQPPFKSVDELARLLSSGRIRILATHFFNMESAFAGHPVLQPFLGQAHFQIEDMAYFQKLCDANDLIGIGEIDVASLTSSAFGLPCELHMAEELRSQAFHPIGFALPLHSPLEAPLRRLLLTVYQPDQFRDLLYRKYMYRPHAGSQPSRVIRQLHYQALGSDGIRPILFLFFGFLAISSLLLAAEMCRRFTDIFSP